MDQIITKSIRKEQKRIKNGKFNKSSECNYCKCTFEFETGVPSAAMMSMNSKSSPHYSVSPRGFGGLWRVPHLVWPPANASCPTCGQAIHCFQPPSAQPASQQKGNNNNGLLFKRRQQQQPVVRWYTTNNKNSNNNNKPSSNSSRSNSNSNSNDSGTMEITNNSCSRFANNVNRARDNKNSIIKYMMMAAMLSPKSSAMSASSTSAILNVPPPSPVNDSDNNNDDNFNNNNNDNAIRVSVSVRSSRPRDHGISDNNNNNHRNSSGGDWANPSTAPAAASSPSSSKKSARWSASSSAFSGGDNDDIRELMLLKEDEARQKEQQIADSRLKFLRLLTPKTRKNRWMYASWHHLGEFRRLPDGSVWTDREGSYEDPAVSTILPLNRGTVFKNVKKASTDFILHPDWI